MNSSTWTIDLPADPAATERLGEWLGARLGPGAVVGLVGELGAGKTTLARGIARGLGCEAPEAVASPTYLLVVEHPGRVPLLHADAFLPMKLAAFLADGGLEYLFEQPGAVVVEWADRIANYMPANTLWVEISIHPEAGRRFVLRAAPAGGLARLGHPPTMA